MAEYKPFILRVGQRTGEAYPVTADALDWYGHNSIPADLPLLLPDDLQQAAAWQERAFTDRVVDREYVRALGGRLFHTLFPEPIARGFRAASDRVKPEGGLRVVLDLPPDLAGLPWELMYDDEGSQGFLARSLTAPVARHFADLPFPRRLPLTGLSGPLRVLVIIASPPNTPPLNDETEVAGLVRGMTARRLRLGEALGLTGRQLLCTRSARRPGQAAQQPKPVRNRCRAGGHLSQGATDVRCCEERGTAIPRRPFHRPRCNRRKRRGAAVAERGAGQAHRCRIGRTLRRTCGRAVRDSGDFECLPDRRRLSGVQRRCRGHPPPRRPGRGGHANADPGSGSR